MFNPYENIFLNLGGIFGYRYFFLMEDENQTVEITEDEEIDFNLVRKRLECGESVFITPINKQQSHSQARIDSSMYSDLHEAVDVLLLSEIEEFVDDMKRGLDNT